MKKKSNLVSLLLAAATLTVGAVLLTPDNHHDYDYDGLFDVGTKVAVGLDGSIYIAGTGTDDAGADHHDLAQVKRNSRCLASKFANSEDESRINKISGLYY